MKPKEIALLVIGGPMTFAPGQGAAAVAAARKVTPPTRAEAGCVEYGFYQDLDDADTLLIFEIWESQDALDQHFQTPHFLAYIEALAGLELKAGDVTQYEVASSTRLSPE